MIIGVVCLALGLLKFFYSEPELGINLTTQFPTVINGTILMILGAGLIIGWFLTAKHEQKIIKAEQDRLSEEKKSRQNDHNWGPGLK